LAFNLRPAGAADAAAIQEIYKHYCLHGHATFEEEPPSVEQIAARMAAVQARDLPFVVAEIGGVVRGYAYASAFRERAAYRYTAEDSVYVDPAFVGQGLGRTLLGAVIDACEAKGVRQLLALIGGSDNAGSIALHHAFGFQPVGTMTEVGFKHGCWVDVVVMQLALKSG